MRRVLLLVLSGCTAPVAAGLDEGDANRVLMALDRANIEATKESDSEGRFRVDVGRGEVAMALRALHDEELPRAKPPGIFEALGKPTLVPSAAEEHARLMAGLAGELERTLEGTDGVLRARVHLSVPVREVFREVPQTVSASVLLEHRGATSPLAADSVERVIAGAVSGLHPSDVAVVLVSRPVAPLRNWELSSAPALGHVGHVGPIVVARGSVRLLQGLLAILVLLVGALSAVTMVLTWRLVRSRPVESKPS